MGNCVGRSKSSSMVWANDDDDHWESVESKEFPTIEKQRVILGERSSTSSSSPSSEACCSTRELKIKMTKKQLKELLGKVDQMHSVPVDQVLSSLIIDHPTDGSFEIQHQRSWRPSLHSIPEVLDQ